MITTPLRRGEGRRRTSRACRPPPLAARRRCGYTKAIPMPAHQCPPIAVPALDAPLFGWQAEDEALHAPYLAERKPQ
jgi:hypothetical protein